MNILEISFVAVLFGIYLSLWKIKEVTLKRSAGIDPKVMSKSSSSIQQFMNKLMIFITLYAVVIIIIHSSGFQYASLFSRYEALNGSLYDYIGFMTGLSGLSFCLYAQIKMGKSWRVGIDEKKKTELVTTGLYRLIRNPTYLGLFMLNAGVWLIWPTWTIFFLNVLFIIFLEIQVRCEEDFLLSSHGAEYAEYMRRTKRYIPFVY